MRAPLSRAAMARDPRTGLADYPFSLAGETDLDFVCARLRSGQGAWRTLGFEGRGAALEAFAAVLARRRPAILAALEVDTGRRRVSGIEIDSVIEALRGWIAMAPGLLPEGWVAGRAAPHIRHAPRWVPYGLVGVISPWNFPLLLAMIDTSPALMAGCAVVVKPSEVTPRFVAPLMDAIAEVPPLASVFAVVNGDGAAGEALIDRADLVCFTGSVATGRNVAARAAGRLIPACLELGGKDPLIVLAGADLEGATDAALRGAVVSTGQACQSIERIYVDRSLHDDFVDLLAEKARAVRFNWPDIAVGDIGPIIFERQAEILAAQIADARDRGGQVITGGGIERHGGGLWLRPTIITGATPDMLVMREETFGPILPIAAFDTEDEAVALANAGDYGLSAAVFAATLDEAERVGRRLDAGAISLNDAALTALFHEAAKQSFKSSGLGASRMGADGLARFFRRQALIANTAKPTPLSAFREDI
jgi:succinate-semialdehyde dehydrogenase/glutarate-semialdehyde dehydrogenase